MGLVLIGLAAFAGSVVGGLIGERIAARIRRTDATLPQWPAESDGLTR